MQKLVTMSFTATSNESNTELEKYYLEQMRKAGLLFDNLAITVEDAPF